MYNIIAKHSKTLGIMLKIKFFRTSDLHAKLSFGSLVFFSVRVCKITCTWQVLPIKTYQTTDKMDDLIYSLEKSWNQIWTALGRRSRQTCRADQIHLIWLPLYEGYKMESNIWIRMKLQNFFLLSLFPEPKVVVHKRLFYCSPKSNNWYFFLHHYCLMNPAYAPTEFTVW